MLEPVTTRNPFIRLWRFVQEPPHITFITSFMWLVLFMGGALIIFDPPRTLTREFSWYVTLIWGVLFLLGGMNGSFGALFKLWWMEKTAIIFTWSGLAMYIATRIQLHFTKQGQYLVSAIIAMCFGLLLTGRWDRISGAQTDPTKGYKVPYGD